MKIKKILCLVILLSTIFLSACGGFQREETEAEYGEYLDNGNYGFDLNKFEF
jgi:hypothetical protein